MPELHDDAQMRRASRRIRETVEREKDRGNTVVWSGGAGAMPALAASLASVKTAWESWPLIDAVFGSSAPNLAFSSLCTGVNPEKFEEMLARVQLRHYVDADNLSLWRIGKKLLRGIAGSPMRINSGRELKRLLSRLAPSDSFRDTSPRLHVLATPYSRDHGTEAQIFSAEHSPDVPISAATTASCAPVIFFREQEIGGHSYTDAGQVEPLPTVSILRAFSEERNIPPERIISLSTMIACDFQPLPANANFFRFLVRNELDHARILVTNQLYRIANGRSGARVILIHPNIDRLNLPPFKAKSWVHDFYRAIDIETAFWYYYRALLREVPRLWNAALDAYDANPAQRLIIATHDEEGNPKIVKSLRQF